VLIQVPIPPTPPSLPSPEIVLSGGPSPEQLLIALAGSAVMLGIIFLGPVGRALADGLRHLFGVRRGQDTAEVEAMREEVAALQHRVAELEERQDFAERLLAQARERGLLPGPSAKD
jgi:hypothetical protein